MTIEELSDKELTLVSSLVKQSKDKLEEIITGAKKVNDVRTKRLIEIVEMVISLKQKLLGHFQLCWELCL